METRQIASAAIIREGAEPPLGFPPIGYAGKSPSRAQSVTVRLLIPPSNSAVCCASKTNVWLGVWDSVIPARVHQASCERAVQGLNVSPCVEERILRQSSHKRMVAGASEGISIPTISKSCAG